jgi:hypothetical protein
VSIGDSGHFDYTYLPQVLFHVPVCFSPRSCRVGRPGTHVSSILAGGASRGPPSTASRSARLAVMNVAGEDRDISMAFYPSRSLGWRSR